VNSDTILIRQIHPSFIQQGHVTSQAFRPTPKDENQLSTYDGDQIEPKAAWIHYTNVLKFRSTGSLGITVQECKDLNLNVAADPASFPEHVLIDFSGHQRKQIEKHAKKLRAYAVRRDWLYQA